MLRPARDRELVQIVDATLADATARARTADGGSWLACRPGCTPCCHGVFRISMLDAARLQEGVRALSEAEPARVEAMQARARALVAELGMQFPGDAATGLLAADTDDGWDAFADLPGADAACPVLDPVTGRCELYASRPLTCRVFGPPVMNEDGIGVCELCYVGATEAEVLQGEMVLQHSSVEEALDSTMPAGETVIAWVIAGASLAAEQR